MKSGIEAAVKAFGAIHIAVNCAGVADAAKTVSKGEPFPIATWSKVIGINLTGTFNIIRFAALAMMNNEPEGRSGERGVIINTASGAAWQGQVGQAAYSASKAGVMGLTLPVARDLCRPRHPRHVDCTRTVQYRDGRRHAAQRVAIHCRSHDPLSEPNG